MMMVRNESVARVVMLLCFGTAMLSLTVHWFVANSVPPDTKFKTTGKIDNGAAVAQQQPPKQYRDTKKPPSQWNQPTAPEKSNKAFFGTQVVVDLSDRRVYVSRKDVVIASYPTGIGKDGWETPIGTFRVEHKELHPSWEHPITGKVFPAGVDSPLGERWIGFWTDGRDHIGFHGTPEVHLVGSAVSHGCLRMRNSDVKMLYNQVSMGTPVEVRP
ncbi:MAG: L,D-transpeptidase [Cyanomargarita calcarea GSE-NOS-MK-12-04C]|uniref:L,D-transpeptidase n=1 Tax=Cyanomargarita calcarea GSE-NOS-MK-12-04C TaxID=2839659 RepID=A0A951UWQ7_9CYAN|nr:L,D-transpeptidase [Cyanomargarita calcarea GSE-NOS-MK-12-04C]